MSDDTPTQAFNQPNPAGPGVPPDDENRRSPLIPILIAVGAVLLVGVLVLGSLLLFHSTSHTRQAAGTSAPTNSSIGTPTPVPTPTVTVTVTATPTNNGGSGSGGGSQKPNGNNVLITSYTISPTTVDCSSSAPAGATNLSIHWTSVNGDVAYFGVNTADAQAAGMGWNLPASGSDADFPAGYHPFTYVCGDSSQEFTITVAGNGSKQSLQFTVKRK